MACTQVWVRVFIVSTSVKYQEWCHWKGRTTIIPSRKRRQNVGSSCIYTCKLRRLNDMLLGALEIFQQRHYSGVPWASRHLNNSKKTKKKKKKLHHRSPTSPVTFLATWPICHSNSTHYSDVMMVHVTWLCAGNSPVTGEFPAHITRKMFPFDDVIMLTMTSVGYGEDLNWQMTQYISPPRVNCRVYMVSLWKRTML